METDSWMNTDPYNNEYEPISTTEHTESFNKPKTHLILDTRWKYAKTRSKRRAGGGFLNSLSHPFCISTTHNAMSTPSVLTDKERFLLASQAEIDWLEAQIKQYEVDLADTPMAEQDDTDEIQANPRDAQRIKLEALIQYNLNTASIGRNLDSAMLAYNALFPKDTDEDSLKRR